MAVSFDRIKACQDKRVLMRFGDGYECIATLHSATQDMDGSLHLIYEKLEWANDPASLALGKDKALYTPGESLVNIEEMTDRDA